MVIGENASLGTAVVRVQATDQDVSVPNRLVQYRIVSGNTAGDFSLDCVSGVLTVAQTLMPCA